MPRTDAAEEPTTPSGLELVSALRSGLQVLLELDRIGWRRTAQLSADNHEVP